MTRWLLLLTAVCLLLAGCDAPGEEASIRGLLEKYEVSGAVTPLPSAESTPATQPAAKQGGLPDGSGPEEYVRLALERNPSIQRAQYKVLRLASRIPQVTSLEDPMVEVAPVGEMAQTAAGMVGVMTGVSQKLPFPGKLDAQGRIAGQEMAAAAQELIETRLGVAADVRRAYWNYSYATSAIAITRENHAILEQLKEVAVAKLRSGTATQQDVLRVTVEISNLDNELLALEQKKTSAVAMLNSLMARPVDATLGSPRTLDLPALALRLDELLTEAACSNPGLAKIKAQIQADRERLSLAKLQQWPDLTVSFDYNFVQDRGMAPTADGKDEWWVGFGLNIPIWFEKLRAAQREARYGILENSADLADMKNRVDFRVRDALSRVETQQKQAAVFRDVIIPQARQTLDVSLSDYKAGKVEFLALVDNWRKVLQFQLLYHQGLAQLEQDLADLQQAIGRDLAPKATPAAPTPPPAPRETKIQIPAAPTGAK